MDNTQVSPLLPSLCVADYCHSAKLTHPTPLLKAKIILSPRITDSNRADSHLWELTLTIQYRFCLSLTDRCSLHFCPQAPFLLDTDKSQSQLLQFAWKDKSWRRLNRSPTSNLHLVGSWKEYDNPDVTSISKFSSAPCCLLPRLDRGC